MISSCEKFPIIFEWGWLYSKFNASKADPNGWHFADDNVKCISTQVSIGSGNVLVVNRWPAIPWIFFYVKQVDWCRMASLGPNEVKLFQTK